MKRHHIAWRNCEKRKKVFIATGYLDGELRGSFYTFARRIVEREAAIMRRLGYTKVTIERHWL